MHSRVYTPGGQGSAAHLNQGSLFLLSVISVLVVRASALALDFRCGKVLTGPTVANSQVIGCDRPVPSSCIGANSWRSAFANISTR